VCRRRHLYADNEPVQFASTYIPLEVAAGTQLEQPGTGPDDMTSRLADLGLAEAHISEAIRVRRATDEEREVLAL
jgi:GntR family transcriptional regulator